jgi:hypothetical protein
MSSTAWRLRARRPRPRRCRRGGLPGSPGAARLQVGQVSEVPARALVASLRPSGWSPVIGSRPGRLVHLRPPGPQRVGQPGHLLGQPGVLQRLLHQRGHVVTLPVGERAEQPLRGGGPADQRVHELLEVARVLREHLAVAVHEAVEVRLGVLTPGVRLQHLVEVGQHVLDPLHGLRIRLPQDFLMPRNWLSRDLAAEQVLEPPRSPAVWLRQACSRPACGWPGRCGRQPSSSIWRSRALARWGREQLGPLLADPRCPGPALPPGCRPATAAADLALLDRETRRSRSSRAAAAVHPAAQQVTQGAGRSAPSSTASPASSGTRQRARTAP